MHTLKSYEIHWQLFPASGRIYVDAGSESDALAQAAANILTDHTFGDPTPSDWRAYVASVKERI